MAKKTKNGGDESDFDTSGAGGGGETNPPPATPPVASTEETKVVPLNPTPPVAVAEKKEKAPEAAHPIPSSTLTAADAQPIWDAQRRLADERHLAEMARSSAVVREVIEERDALRAEVEILKSKITLLEK